MPIPVTCACGKTLQVKNELAGKNVRCPACKQPLSIPAAAAASSGSQRAASAPQASAASGFPGGLDDLFEEEGLKHRQGATCPSCTAEMKPGAILCLACGFNTQTGERHQAYKTEAERTLLGHTLLDKAQVDMEHDQQLQKKLQGAGLPWWVLLLILLAVIGLAVFFVVGVNMITGPPE